MLNLFKINRLTCEIFQIMHDYLFSIWHEHCDPVVFGVLFKGPLRLLDLDFDLLEAAKVNFSEDFLLDLFEILFLKFDLI